MSNELQKWTPLETKLAELRQCRIARRQSELIPTRMASDTPTPDVLDLPRICAVHDKPYTARYVRGFDGRFEYAQSIQLTEMLYHGQYSGNRNTAMLSGEALAVEICAWCGAHGRGSIQCGTCRMEICYGKVVRTYFRCRPSCGGHGEMTGTTRKHQGFCPRLGKDKEWATGA